MTAGTVIVSGPLHFDPKLAFDFPPSAFGFSLGFLTGLGAAARVGVYDYLGYYDVCYIGDEVRNPGRVIPRSILISLVAVALIHMMMNLLIIDKNLVFSRPPVLSAARVNQGAKALAKLAQQFQEVEAIGVIPEDLLPFVAAGGHVVSAARTLDAQSPCHATHCSTVAAFATVG